MKYLSLIEGCAKFERLAQQKPEKKIVLDPKKKNEDFWGNFLLSAMRSYMYKFPNVQAAKKVFDAVAAYKKAPAYGQDKDFKELNSIDAALQESEERLKSAGLNPIEVLKSKGAQNLNPDIINILRRNLKALIDAEDFSKYQHFYLVPPGSAHPKDVIDLDADPSAGY